MEQRPISMARRPKAKKRKPPRPALSPREIEIIGHFARGLTTKKIARVLAIGGRTIETHIASAKRKTGAVTLAQLVAIAARDGIVAIIEPERAAAP